MGESNISNLKLLLMGCVMLICGLMTAKGQIINNPNYDRAFSVSVLGIPTHFGISLGFNRSDFRIDRSPFLEFNDSIFVVESTRGPGFNLGIISDYRLGEYVNLRFIPSLLFAEKRLNYTLMNDSLTSQNIESIYVDLPLDLKFKSQRIGNFRIYVLAGVRYSMDMQSNAKARNAPDRVKIKQNDFSIDYGLGFDFYFPMFKFSPEIKIAQGFKNILVPDPDLIYTNVLEKLFSRTVIISFHIE